MFCDNSIQVVEQTVGGPRVMSGMHKFALYGLMAMLLALTVMVLAVGLVQPARAAETAVSGPGTLVIHVRNVSPKGGTLRLGLYDAKSYPDDDSRPVASADVSAQMGVTTITLNNIPAGTYAIQTFQDFNSNGEMDTSWLGLPQEPYGFSRDARPRLSKPGFERVKFEVVAGVNEQTIHLQNSVSVVAEN